MKKDIKIEKKKKQIIRTLDSEEVPPVVLELHGERIIKDLAKAFKLGAYLETAASYAGVEAKVLRRWIKKGKEIRRSKIEPIKRKEQLYLKMYLAVKRAIALSEINALSRIDEASVSDWKAAAWRLSRRNPARWSGTKTVDHKINPISVDHKHLVEIDYDSLPIDVCEKLLQMAKAGSSEIAKKDYMIELKPEPNPPEE